MVRLLMTFCILLTTISLYGQKNKKESKIPTINQQYQRFSIFAFKDSRYLHQETNNVWMDTFIETKPKVQMVFLPGLENRQSCKYETSECNFFENENGIQLIVMPIKCTTLNGTEEQRVLRIHHITDNHSSDYIYSLGYMDAKDIVLFHNYSDSELGQLLSKNLIRFE